MNFKTIKITMSNSQWQSMSQCLAAAIEEVTEYWKQSENEEKISCFNLIEIKQKIDVGLFKMFRDRFSINLSHSQAMGLYIAYLNGNIKTSDQILKARIQTDIITKLDKTYQ